MFFVLKEKNTNENKFKKRSSAASDRLKYENEIITRPDNIDLMLDYYFGGTALVSGGVFFKSIDNWLYEFADNNYEYYV